MASEHAALIGGVVGLHASHFGSVCQYTPPSNSPSTDPIRIVNAIIGAERREKTEVETGLAIQIVRDVTIVTDSKLNSYCGLTDPVRGAVVTIDGVDYGVEVVTTGSGEGTQTLKIVRHELNAFVRQNYYRRV